MNLDELLNSRSADDEAEVKLNGQTVTLGVCAPSHPDAIEMQRVSASFGQRVEERDDGLAYDVDDLEPHYSFIDEHIVTIEGEEWIDLDEAKRTAFIEALSTHEFWGLFHSIRSAGSPLKEDEKND